MEMVVAMEETGKAGRRVDKAATVMSVVMDLARWTKEAIKEVMAIKAATGIKAETMAAEAVEEAMEARQTLDRVVAEAVVSLHIEQMPLISFDFLILYCFALICSILLKRYCDCRRLKDC